MIGPGKYDSVCTKAREQANAQGAILLIFGGDKGSGFSVQLPLDLIPVIPDMLRDIANMIESDEPHL